MSFILLVGGLLLALTLSLLTTSLSIWWRRRRIKRHARARKGYVHPVGQTRLP